MKIHDTNSFITLAIFLVNRLCKCHQPDADTNQMLLLLRLSWKSLRKNFNTLVLWLLYLLNEVIYFIIAKFVTTFNLYLTSNKIQRNRVHRRIQLNEWEQVPHTTGQQLSNNLNGFEMHESSKANFGSNRKHFSI